MTHFNATINPQLFDKPQAGLIDAEELRNILLNMGEALSEQEVDELLKDAEVGPDGKIAYESEKSIFLLPLVGRPFPVIEACTMIIILQREERLKNK